MYLEGSRDKFVMEGENEAGGCDAATRHGPHDFDFRGFRSLHPRLFTSCRSAAGDTKQSFF